MSQVLSSTEAAAERSKDILNRRFHGMSSMSRYEQLSKLGQGTFGEVVKARNSKDKKLVALKSIIVHNNKGGFPVTALREVNIMKRLKNKNVLQLLELICEKKTDIKNVKNTPTFYMVTPYAPYDLTGLLNNPDVQFKHGHIKCMAKQLLEGINYIHQQHYFHRDIKASNILIDHNGVLKIADFGLARNYEGTAPKKGQGPCGSTRRYTGLVVTRWYRAPELLLGDQRYTTSIDMWGVGCVIAEMFERKPILQGKSDLDQGRIIFELVGPPTQNNWRDYDQLPHAQQFTFPASKRDLEHRFWRMGQEGIEMIDGLLKLDPKARMNALDALDHPYFKASPIPCRPEQLPRFDECHEMDSEKFKEAEKNGNANHERPPPTATKREPWGRQAPSISRATAADGRYPTQPPMVPPHTLIGAPRMPTGPAERLPSIPKGPASFSHEQNGYRRPDSYIPSGPASHNGHNSKRSDSYVPSHSSGSASISNAPHAHKKRRYDGDHYAGPSNSRDHNSQSKEDVANDADMSLDYSDDSLSADLKRATFRSNKR